ncbi:MAG: hypothetical protein ABW321_13510, partial [Polyangiales bacterium]
MFVLPLAAASHQTLCRADDKPAAKAAPSASDALLGEWWTEGNEGRVRFTRDKEGLFRGTTTCCIPDPP